MADCYQQGCILSEGHECLHMSAEEATAGELRHQLAKRDRQIASLKLELGAKVALANARYEDAMIAHRWFAARFGEEMNGRDFAVKCAMASKAMHDSNEAAEARVKELEDEAVTLRMAAIPTRRHSDAAWEEKADLLKTLLAAVITAAEPLEAWLTQKAAAIEKLRLDSICLEHYEVGDLDLGVLRALAAAVEKARESKPVWESMIWTAL